MQKESNLRYQSATEMLRDLERSLKNPEGNFVEEKNYDEGLTQRIPTINSERLENQNKKNTQKKNNSQKKIIITVVSVIALVILSVLLGYFVVASIFSSPKNITVPDVTGLTIEEAEAKLKELKITYEISDEKYSSSVEAGKIISQEPPKGYRILENKPVKIVVSKGVETTVVPKVAGKKLAEAKEDLEKAKLEVEIIEETSKKIEEGVVISQEPKENTNLNAGDKVKIYVSKGTGIKQIAVPSVTGKTEEEAKEELTKQGFEVDSAYEEDKTKTNGTVLKQSLDVGKTVDEGTKIAITVNKIAEEKKADIFVDVKSLTGGYTEPVKNTVNQTEQVTEEKGDNKTQNQNAVTTKEPEIERTVHVKVTVNDETICDEKQVDKNITKLTAGKAVGTGSVTVKLFINDVKKDQQTIDLTQVTSYTFD